MSDLLNNLSSVSWWVTVVIAGLLVNIVAVYVQRNIDKFQGSAFGWWRSRSKKLLEARIIAIEYLSNNLEERNFRGMYIITLYLRCVIFLLLACACLILLVMELVVAERVPTVMAIVAAPVLFFITTISLLLSMRSFSLAMDHDDLLRKSRQLAEEKAGRP